MTFSRNTPGISWVLSMMPYRLVRDQWEYLKKMERDFSDQTGHGSYHFLFLFRIPYISKGASSLSNFGRTDQTGPPPEVIPKLILLRSIYTKYALSVWRNYPSGGIIRLTKFGKHL